MAQSGLRLKAELIAKPTQAPVGDNFLAKVWVDSGVFHLDGAYSYLIPGNLSQIVQVGSLVDVPFNGREISALVISRESWGDQANLKSIAGVQGIIPLVSEDQIHLIQRLSAGCISHPFDLIRSIVPSRLVSIEKNRSDALPSSKKSNMKRRSSTYLQLPPFREMESLIAAKLAELLRDGPTIAIFPDVRTVERIASELESRRVSFTRYDSSQSRSDHFSSYLDSLQGLTELVIGTRSAVFAPLVGLWNIVMYNEGSEHFYERRSPGWNARDVALERSKFENLSLTFIGYTPSLEVCQLIQAKEVTYRKSSARTDVREYDQPHGELIPSRALQEIKKALKDGPVLFVAPNKGWAHAIRCARCKTLSKCECGGNFEIASEKSLITCNHCQIVNPQWKCAWCENPRFALVGRGMERHAHEIGKMLPGVPVRSSNADTPILEEVSNGIFISTQAMAPKAAQGYSAIVFLEGNRINNQPDMRAQERMRDLYFSHSALVRESGAIILIQDQGNPIVTALRLWNPLPILERELQEREDLNLPPFTHTVELTMPKEEVTRFKNALIKSQEDGRLPSHMRILGPITKGDKSSIVLLAKPVDSESVNLLVHEFMRRRSLTKKTLPSLRIDPYSLSR
jgi:primosomal protein N' (replication factor Y) (superfamily II helicase)